MPTLEKWHPPVLMKLTWASRALLRLNPLSSLAFPGNYMDALSDGCVFQDAPTLEVAAAPSMSTVKDVQLPGSSILAAIPTNT